MGRKGKAKKKSPEVQAVDFGNLVDSSTLWAEKDAATMEQILCGVTDDGVPRISEALSLVAKALGKEENLIVQLNPCDAVLTDAVRCILCHPWLVGSIERKTSEGAVVASFFTQPFGNGRVLNLFSSQKSFQRLEAEATKAGAKLSAVELTFGAIIMMHLPNMTIGAMQKNKAPEAYAVRAVSFDPVKFWDPALDEVGDLCEEVVSLSETTFPMLQQFCHCYALAGSALDSGPFTAEQWKSVLCKQSLNAIMTDDAVFTSEQGLLLFCYPGDASKVLKHHQRKGMLGLEAGKVSYFEPSKFLELIKLHADQGVATLICATAVEQGGALRLHGLSLAPKLFLESALPAVKS